MTLLTTVYHELSPLLLNMYLNSEVEMTILTTVHHQVICSFFILTEEQQQGDENDYSGNCL